VLPFQDAPRTPAGDWRHIVRFGRNVASYKFALGQALLDLGARQQTFVRQQKRRAQRHRARAGPRYHSAAQAAHFFDPGGELARVADGRGKQKQPNAWRCQDDRFFPDVAAIFVAEIMRFIYHDEVGAHIMAAAHGVE